MQEEMNIKKLNKISKPYLYLMYRFLYEVVLRS